MVSTNRSFFLVLLVFLFSTVLSAQDKKYIVYFKNKNNTPYFISDPSQYLSAKAIERRTKQNIPITDTDLPVTPAYLDSLAGKGAQVLYSLKWMNAAAVIADSLEMVDINTLTFVQTYERVAREMNVRSLHQTEKTKAVSTKKSITSYGNSYNQIHMLEADQMHQDGFHGEGILMALLDAGFKNAPSMNYLTHLYTNNRVVATYDFVDQEIDVYDDHHHGLEALSTIAAYLEDALIGTAFNASFVLLRTEDEVTETEIEEANWARGAEYADSIGVDIISSSLGYTTFDVASTNHTYQDMDGNTTIAARAADLAASKGILVVASAGNEGGNGWHYIGTPADGDSVLAIGAVDATMDYAFFSSVGPSSNGRIKPDLAAKGADVTLGSVSGIINNSGTSYSCPLVAGLAAGIWQAFPSLTNMQIAEALRKSASQYNTPDQYLGYGIPGYKKAQEYINDSIFNIGIDFRIFPNPIKEGHLFFTSGVEYFNQPVTIKMYDLLGRSVAEDKVMVTGVRNETSILASDFRDGVYVLRFYFPDKTIKTKLIKY
jgi:serine protease AprX